MQHSSALEPHNLNKLLDDQPCNLTYSWSSRPKMESTQSQSLHTPDQITGFSDAKTMTPRQKNSQLSTPLMWPIFEKQTESNKEENKNLKNNQVALMCSPLN